MEAGFPRGKVSGERSYRRGKIHRASSKIFPFRKRKSKRIIRQTRSNLNDDSNSYKQSSL
ncbi:hypothetical protein LEP1GSC088_1985 [Leptospira interrogans str. L1207]|nr:hypothetical protein LEP1GSC088_1985 [Leptospira interrogans str. L1207]